MTFGFWFWLVAFVVVGTAYLYNRVIGLRQRAKGAWSDIDVQLKRRWELIPNLSEAVKGAMAYEKGTLESVVAARGRAMAAESAGPAARGSDERALGAATHTLLALVEKYPDLTANANIRDLQHSLVEIEDALQHARRYYNAVVRDHNAAIESFPTLLLAKVARFYALEFFQAEDEARVAPAVDLDRKEGA